MENNFLNFFSAVYGKNSGAFFRINFCRSHLHHRIEAMIQKLSIERLLVGL